jgi:hypothetical protein
MAQIPRAHRAVPQEHPSPMSDQISILFAHCVWTWWVLTHIPCLHYSFWEVLIGYSEMREHFRQRNRHCSDSRSNVHHRGYIVPRIILWPASIVPLIEKWLLLTMQCCGQALNLTIAHHASLK